jgi:hypothetical protein
LTVGLGFTRFDVRVTDNRIMVELTDEERDVLASGLLEWGGPASPTDAWARVMGFADRNDLVRGHGRRLAEALMRGGALPTSELRRALLATEIVFASDVVGSGVDWTSTTGRSDGETIAILRGIQRKVVGA